MIAALIEVILKIPNVRNRRNRAGQIDAKPLTGLNRTRHSTEISIGLVVAQYRQSLDRDNCATWRHQVTLRTDRLSNAADLFTSGRA
jgi:hypothetical protein